MDLGRGYLCWATGPSQYAKLVLDSSRVTRIGHKHGTGLPTYSCSHKYAAIHRKEINEVTDDLARKDSKHDVEKRKMKEELEKELLSSSNLRRTPRVTKRRRYEASFSNDR